MLVPAAGVFVRRGDAVNRRDFLSGSLAMVGSAGYATLARPGEERHAHRWGVQIFTVLAQLQRDFEGTLRLLAGAGYSEIETIGSLGRDPTQLRETLARHGLRSPSQHIASPALYNSFAALTRGEIDDAQNRANYLAAYHPDRLDALVDNGIMEAKAIGQTYLTWPILLPEQLADLKTLQVFIDFFNRAGGRCAAAGLTFVFHNHHREFARLGNEVIFDLILRETDPVTVKMEMDVYWVTKGGENPAAYLLNHPGRFKMAHLKDIAADGTIAAVGEGVIDFPNLLQVGRAAGIEHFFVEYDRIDNPMGALRRSIPYLEAAERAGRQKV